MRMQLTRHCGRPFSRVASPALCRYSPLSHFSCGLHDWAALRPDFQVPLGQLDRAAPFVILWDVRQLAFPEPWALRVAGEHQRRRVADFRAHLRGEAHVITSPFIRAAVRMVNWFQPAPQPQAYFRTGAEAERWLREQLGVYAATGSG